MDRNQILQKAIKAGLDQEVITRLPTYTISQMLINLENCEKVEHTEESCSSPGTTRTTKSSDSESSVSSVFSMAKSDDKHVNPTPKKRILCVGGMPAPKAFEFLESATATEDDVETIVETNLNSDDTLQLSPSDQKYARFKTLIDLFKDMQNAITTNTKLKSANSERLDEEDTAVIDNEIAYCQQNIESIKRELLELQTWFEEVQKEKLLFYMKFSTRIVDTSGQMKKHFQHKLKKIQVYMEQIANDVAILTY